MSFDPASILFWITIGKIVVGCGLLSVLVGAVYKFRSVIFTIMGFMLLSNLLCLYLIMGLTR